MVFLTLFSLCKFLMKKFLCGELARPDNTEQVMHVIEKKHVQDFKNYFLRTDPRPMSCGFETSGK